VRERLPLHDPFAFYDALGALVTTHQRLFPPPATAAHLHAALLDAPSDRLLATLHACGFDVPQLGAALAARRARDELTFFDVWSMLWGAHGVYAPVPTEQPLGLALHAACVWLRGTSQPIHGGAVPVTTHQHHEYAPYACVGRDEIRIVEGDYIVHGMLHVRGTLVVLGDLTVRGVVRDAASASIVVRGHIHSPSPLDRSTSSISSSSSTMMGEGFWGADNLCILPSSSSSTSTSAATTQHEESRPSMVRMASYGFIPPIR
jgi:hypothetical protein